MGEEEPSILARYMDGHISQAQILGPNLITVREGSRCQTIYIFVWVTYTLAKLPAIAGISWTKQGDAQTFLPTN